MYGHPPPKAVVSDNNGLIFNKNAIARFSAQKKLCLLTSLMTKEVNRHIFSERHQI